jgi:hypothetical protein
MKNVIREAYEQARQEQLHTAPERPMPPWENLPLEIRESMLKMFYAGRLSALQEKGSDVVREILADADVKDIEQLHDRIADLRAALYFVLESGALDSDRGVREVVRRVLGEAT